MTPLLPLTMLHGATTQKIGVVEGFRRGKLE